MLVRDLIEYMHPNEVVKVSIWKNNDTHTILFEGESLGKVENLKISEDIMDREVIFYTMYYDIVTCKEKEEKYEPLPYIELEVTFNIAVYQGGKANETYSY